jgi:hypothetical protein
MPSNVSWVETVEFAPGAARSEAASAWLPRQTRRSDMILITAVVVPMALVTFIAAFLPALPDHIRLLAGVEAALLGTFCWAWLRHSRAFAAVALGEGFLLVQRSDGAIERYRMPDAMRSLEQEYGFIWVAFRENGHRVRLSDYMLMPAHAETFRTWLLRHGVRLSVARQDFIGRAP